MSNIWYTPWVKWCFSNHWPVDIVDGFQWFSPAVCLSSQCFHGPWCSIYHWHGKNRLQQITRCIIYGYVAPNWLWENGENMGKWAYMNKKNVYTLFSDRAIGMGEHQTICRNITPNHNLDIGTLSGYNVIHYSLKIYVVIRPFCRIPAQWGHKFLHHVIYIYIFLLMLHIYKYTYYFPLLVNSC